MQYQEGDYELFESFVRSTNVFWNSWSEDWTETEMHLVIYRVLDIVDCFGYDPKEAANVFNSAHKKAWSAAKKVYQANNIDYAFDEIPTTIEQEAKSAFYQVIQEDFGNHYLQYKWKRLQAIRKQRGTIDPVLYEDYETASDLSSFVHFCSPFDLD